MYHDVRNKNGFRPLNLKDPCPDQHKFLVSVIFIINPNLKSYMQMKRAF